MAGMKLFSPQTVHLAVNIIDRYLLLRSLPRSKLQLLGITSLLLAARWSSEFILTVREASWLTEETYQYENVVRMMGGVVAAFKGEVRVGGTLIRVAIFYLCYTILCFSIYCNLNA